MRIVLDTNVLVSGLLSKAGKPGRLILAASRDAVVLILSEQVLDELRDVLSRPHLERYLIEAAAESYVEAINAVAEIVSDPLPAVNASQDPKDNMVLATALVGHADLIVSGDKRHLLALGQYEGIPILSPAAAVERLEAKGLV